jgi:hypothetical protein
MRLSLIVTVFLVGVLAMGPASGEEQPRDPEIERLTKEKQKLELELDIAKKKAELLRASLPKPETKALEGKISVDEKFGLPSQVLTYHAMRQIVAQASRDLDASATSVSTLIVFSEKEIGAVAAYGSALAQIQALQNRYTTLLGAAVAAAPLAALLAPEIAGTLLRSIADVAALFRTDVEIKATTVTVDKTAVVAELARALAETNPRRTVIYPPLYLPKQFFKDPQQSSELMKKLTALLADRARSAEMIAVFEAKSPKEQADDPQRSKITQLKAINEQVDRLVTALSIPDEKTGLSLLTNLLKGELLRAMLADAATRILVVDVNASGGANKTTKNLFTGTKLFHSGGAVITVMMLDVNGAIGHARTYSAATEFVQFDSDEEWKLVNRF